MSAIKLGSLLIRTLAKPVANSIKTQAKQHPSFNQFCINVAQFTHRVEMNLKMSFLGYKKEVIRPLNDKRAVEAGANFLSESILFTVAAALILAESTRSAISNKNRRNLVDESISRLESEVEELRTSIEESTHANSDIQKHVQLLEEENGQLRRILDEIISVSIGLRDHTSYDRPAVMTFPGFEKQAQHHQAMALKPSEAEAVREALQRGSQAHTETQDAIEHLKVLNNDTSHAT
ncbi:hypothetical protein BZG36_05063 [Bifiguratus adelaidae]|uniref:OPA3-like protein n=1 Tax=Bifiguratus adelaidae TaxID=1938954 RepID=A0A261XVB6_9FUNG|nr:hypothetical protein BZG36_05063 [Bifiguratus adelaidae]